jgi:hypothetical protein
MRRIYQANGWPFDKRARQAYVHRFFQWLTLPPEEQREYPTVILSVADSVALRQCLWLDFYFGTAEAPAAVAGLYSALKKTGGSPFEVSSRTHREFCAWIDAPRTDNTKRGPFSRWLNDAGLAYALPDRRANETSVLIELTTPAQITPEALVYGLMLEFGRPFDSGRLSTVQILRSRLQRSKTVAALMLNIRRLPELLAQAQDRGYIELGDEAVRLNPADFAAGLRRSSPFPALSWVREQASFDNAIDRDSLAELQRFPEDGCYATSGSPFDDEADLATIVRRKRDQSFGPRVAAAYRNRCLITGLAFRSPYRSAWYGDAAHIVPHSGVGKDGTKVYGRPVVSNGIFLSNLHHWCFDRGWITLNPVMRHELIETYKVEVAAIALDDFFHEEAGYLLKFDNKSLPVERLPDNRQLWPSLLALEWHRENVFDD